MKENKRILGIDIGTVNSSISIWNNGKAEKLREKKYKLKLIASGFIPDPPNIIKMQRRIYDEILTPSNQKLIDKLDDELISYVYKDKQTGNSRDKKDFNKIKNMNIILINIMDMVFFFQDIVMN